METRNPDIAFTRNPIRFIDMLPGVSAQRSFTVSVGGSTAYSGHYSAPATVEIGEIAEAYVEKIPDPEDGTPIGEAGTMLQLEDPYAFQLRRVAVADGLRPLKLPFYAIPGGVSPQNFRRLRELDSDIFAARLLDKRHNFFLTTRTHGWRIVMDELELFPLTFVNLQDSEDSSIEVRAAGSDFSVAMDCDLQGIYAIDFAKIRRRIAADDGFLGSVFDVVCDGYLACQVVVRETRPETDTTLVKFRNSMGAFEVIHLSGERLSKASPEKDGSDGKRYASDTGRYEKTASRRGVALSVEAYTGCKDNDELAFILDMAASEEAYLQLPTGWTRVIPSIEGLATGDPQKQPTSVKIIFTLAEERDRQTPDINSLEDFERPRIFSDEHTDQFN